MHFQVSRHSANLCRHFSPCCFPKLCTLILWVSPLSLCLLESHPCTCSSPLSLSMYIYIYACKLPKGDFTRRITKFCFATPLYDANKLTYLNLNFSHNNSLEICLMKYLLQCHVAIDFKFDCIKSIVCIKSINDIFLNRLPLLNSKQSKETKSFSLFSRSSSQQKSMPVVYQWYKQYYQCLLNKVRYFY